MSEYPDPDNTFETVDDKVAETEFFLQALFNGAGSGAFRFYFSAFLSAARTVTLSLQKFYHIQGFQEWYERHQGALSSDYLARYFLKLRNAHVHGASYPVGGYSIQGMQVTQHFKQGKGMPAPPPDHEDLPSAARAYFIRLLEIVYDCYVIHGPAIDPQQRYAKENYGGGIDSAECEVWGFVRTSLIEEGLTEDDRWEELRGQVGECTINHIFYAYLGKPTPAPERPEDYEDFFDDSPEAQGWDLVPAGFDSLEKYRQWFAARK